MPTAEHVVLESDFREVPDPRAARKVHARIVFGTRLRRRVVQLQIIDYYYLSVRSRSRSTGLDYVLDLRFIDTPRVSRHIAWRWIAASLLLTGLAYEMVVRLGVSPAPWWQRHRLTVCAAVTGASAAVTLVALYRTTETVSLSTSAGAARVLECTGGFGTLRGVRRFMGKVAAHIRLASAARRSTKAEHLRDEMREHLRLKELGVLTDQEYEAAKVRILDQHQRPRGPSARARLGHDVGQVFESDDVR
jgi:hypothetical protein